MEGEHRNDGWRESIGITDGGRKLVGLSAIDILII